MPARPSERRLRAVQGQAATLAPNVAAAEAWAILAEAADRALAVRGLPAEDVGDLREIRQAAAEVAGMPPCRPAPSTSLGRMGA